MTITEQQLANWASAPSPSEMEKIRNARVVIEDILKRHLPVDEIKRKFDLNEYKYEVYLQGSYANSTNVSFDSDLDIAVQLNSSFFNDKSQLTIEQKHLHQIAFNDSRYKFKDFKMDIFNAIQEGLSEKEVHWQDKCIGIDANTYRVETDVVACLQHRIYKRFISYSDQEYVEGMKFFDTSNDKEIINFPKIHLRNCEAKNKDSSGKFKKLIRIYKNMRNELVMHNKIGKDSAPSYYIENLLYNCTSQCFDGNYTDCILKTLQFIFDAVQTTRIIGFVCANEQDTLIGIKTWNLNDLRNYIDIIADYYLEEK